MAFDRDGAAVAALAQGGEEGAQRPVALAGRPTVGVGDVGVGDASGVLAHHLEALLLEHDVEEIGDHAHLREVVRVEELDRLGEGVDLVGLAAVQRFEDRLEAVLGGEIAGEPHGAGQLLPGCGGVDALGGGAGGAGAQHDRGAGAGTTGRGGHHQAQVLGDRLVVCGGVGESEAGGGDHREGGGGLPGVGERRLLPGAVGLLDQEVVQDGGLDVVGARGVGGGGAGAVGEDAVLHGLRAPSSGRPGGRGTRRPGAGPPCSDARG